MEMTTNNSNYSVTSPLPPCKICGAKASGLHYGVNTCEACKGFFRRAIKFNKNYTCFREQNCDVMGGRSVRTSCPFCRLQKCLRMGMAHKAIKTGRYTHAKRTENIMEVKRLENVKKTRLTPSGNSVLRDKGSWPTTQQKQQQQHRSHDNNISALEPKHEDDNNDNNNHLLVNPNHPPTHPLPPSLPFRHLPTSSISKALAVSSSIANSNGESRHSGFINPNNSIAHNNHHFHPLKTTNIHENENTSHAGQHNFVNTTMSQHQLHHHHHHHDHHLLHHDLQHHPNTNINSTNSILSSFGFFNNHMSDINNNNNSNNNINNNNNNNNINGISFQYNSAFGNTQHPHFNISSVDKLPMKTDNPFNHQLLASLHSTNSNGDTDNDSIEIDNIMNYPPSSNHSTLTQLISKPLPLSPSRDPGHEGIYISIPTPPLSYSSLEENGSTSPFSMSMGSNPNIHLSEIFPEINSDTGDNPMNMGGDIPPTSTKVKEEIIDFPDDDFMMSTSDVNNPFTQLLPPTISSISPVPPPPSSSAFPFTEIKVENSDFDDEDGESDNVDDDNFMSSVDSTRHNYYNNMTTLAHLLPQRSPNLSVPFPSSPSSLSMSSFSPSSTSSPSLSSSSPSSSSSSSSSSIFKLGDVSSAPTSPVVAVPLQAATPVAPHPDLHPKMTAKDKQDLVDALTQSHRKFVITLAEYDCEFITTIQQQFVEKRKAKAEIFGITSQFVQDEEYTEVFKQTGLDVDGRQEMRLHALRSLGYYLKTVISFAQSIPGFKSLCLGDQQQLIKMANIEQWFMNAFLGINSQEGVVLMPNLKVFTYDEFASLLGESFACKCFELAPAFQNLALTYEILVLWKAILLLSSDRCDLKEPERVGQLQELYLNLLLEYIDKQRPSTGDSPNQFSRLISLSSLLRELDTAMPNIFDPNETLGINAENIFKQTGPFP